MMRSSGRVAGAAVAAVTTIAACRTTAGGSAPPDARPAGTAAAEPRRAPAPGVRADSARRGYTEADVRFMQHMIAHHAQALAMTTLVPARSTRREVRLLAQRIEVSQHDEIAAMRRWLSERREAVPSVAAQQHDHHPSPGSARAPSPGAAGAHGALMPGMLTPEELARLTAATGAEFDRLFLQFMIRHHEGALAMVAELLATPGAGQEVEIFRFASDVDADQRAEIRRMRGVQSAPPSGS